MLRESICWHYVVERIEQQTQERTKSDSRRSSPRRLYVWFSRLFSKSKQKRKRCTLSLKNSHFSFNSSVRINTFFLNLCKHKWWPRRINRLARHWTNVCPNVYNNIFLLRCALFGAHVGNKSRKLPMCLVTFVLSCLLCELSMIIAFKCGRIWMLSWRMYRCRFLYKNTNLSSNSL